ncbi:MAG: class I SAM-dependent methyltransferase [Ignavibacteria bacterium]|nr:class I SAM-dependent methyltransferase [Ignavibacteria bacterium]
MTLNPETYRKNLLKYTTLAFRLLPEIEKPAILDVGCGTGIPTIHLAEMCNGSVVGVDVDRVALEKLEAKIREKGLSSRVRAIRCPMGEMPFDDGAFDIVWAEGSVGHLGFTSALNLLRRFLKSEGFLVIHHDAVDHMNKISAVESANFMLRGFFVLSESVWWNDYYKHLEAELTKAASAEPPFELSSLREEVEQFKRDPQNFRSAFFIMQKQRRPA